MGKRSGVIIGCKDWILDTKLNQCPINSTIPVHFGETVGLQMSCFAKLYFYYHHAHFILYTNTTCSGCRKRVAHIDSSMATCKMAAPVTGTTLRFTGPVPADSRQ